MSATNRSLNPPPGSHCWRAGGAEGLVARAARRGQLVRVSVPDDRVSRAGVEARSGSGKGGGAAAPTSDADGTNQAPRNWSAAEIPRSRRVWASGCVSPPGARRDRPSGHPDRAEEGKRGQRSGIGAITYKVGGTVRQGAARRRAEGAQRSRMAGPTSARARRAHYPRTRGRGLSPRTAGGHGNG